MIPGVSTACLYPMQTEKSLELLLDVGYRTFEIFFNCESEFTRDFVRSLTNQLAACDATIYSVHPYTAAYEPFMFFSDYTRRFDDSMEQYKRLFELTALAGARVFVFHGDRKGSILPDEEYCERFFRLYKAARTFGIILAQENVSHCRVSGADSVRKMRALLGNDAKFVLDVKQSFRAGVNLQDMLSSMGGAVVNVHISDSDEQHDCLLPGAGIYDSTQLVAALKESGYDGPLITEVYRSNFGQSDELCKSLQYLRQFCHSINSIIL